MTYPLVKSDDTMTFILRRKYRTKLSRLRAIIVLCFHGLGLLGAIRALGQITGRGHAIVTMPITLIEVATFASDLEGVGVFGRRYGGVSGSLPYYPVPFEDWKIGMEFWCGSGSGFPWRVTDVGRRVITAIHLNRPHDESWYNGPPYAVAEVVFDENDLQVCYLEKPEEWME